jgi:hypothetical protein
MKLGTSISAKTCSFGRQATRDDVAELRRENEHLKQLVAELALKNRVLKKV